MNGIPDGGITGTWCFRKKTKDSSYQKFHFRNTIQKVKAPVARSENDFDPGAKYHVAADSQYIRYFCKTVPFSCKN